MPSPSQDLVSVNNDLNTSSGIKVQQFDFLERFKVIRTTARQLAKTIQHYSEGTVGEESVLNKSSKLAELIKSTPELSGPMFTQNTLDMKFGALESAFAATYISLNILNNLYLGHATNCLEGISPLESQYDSVKSNALRLVESSATFLADAIRASEKLPPASGSKVTLTGQLRPADLINWWDTLGIERAV